jgi:hypothetical protein
MTIGKGKRPRDPNQFAKWIVDRSTSETPADTAPAKAPAAPVNLSEYLGAVGRKGGQIGGKRRLKTMKLTHYRFYDAPEFDVSGDG